MNLFKKRHRTIAEILPEFLEGKSVETQGITAQSYQHHTEILLEWLKRQGLSGLPINKITPQNMRGFFLYLARERDLDRPTCERYLIHIRLLFRYAQTIGEIDRLPFSDVILPRKKKDSSAAVIRPEHLKPLLEEIKKCDPQLFLACMIQYFCFIRPGRELRYLKIGDVYLDCGYMTVRLENAKSKREDSVTIPHQLIDILREYGIGQADKSLYIFGVKKKFGTKPVSVNMLRWRFNKIRDRLQLPKEYKFYSFKHTGASMLHQSGASLRDIMDQLRHVNLSATQHYIKKHSGIISERIRDNFPSPI